MSNLTLKKDPFVLGLAAVVVIAAAVLVGLGKVSWQQASAFLLAAFALPGLFGAKTDDGQP